MERPSLCFTTTLQMKSIRRCWNVQRWSGLDLVEWSGVVFLCVLVVVRGWKWVKSGLSWRPCLCSLVSQWLEKMQWLCWCGFFGGSFSGVTHVALLFFLTTSSLVSLFILLLTVSYLWSVYSKESLFKMLCFFFFFSLRTSADFEFLEGSTLGLFGCTMYYRAPGTNRSL